MKLRTTLIAGALLLIAQTASAGPFSYTCADCPIIIGPDPSVITSIITVADSGTIADLSLLVDAFHTFEGDLVISLEHGGTTVVLQDNEGGADDYLGNTYASLTDFNGMDINGDWTLTIEDLFFGDAGELFDWEIFGDADMATGAPEPGILILMGLGLAGIGFARRRS